MVSLDPAIWAAAVMTIGIYSLGFKYNKLYKFCEFTFVGLGTGYATVLAWDNITRIGISNLAAGKVYYLIPIALGIMLYMRYQPTAQWLSRYPLAMIIGIGTGVAVRGTVQADLVTQIAATAQPLFGAGDPLKFVNNLIVLVLTVTGLIFFIFTLPTQRLKGGSLMARIGRLGLMIGMGTLFADTVAGRYAFLVDRVRFLLIEWLGLR